MVDSWGDITLKPVIIIVLFYFGGADNAFFTRFFLADVKGALGVVVGMVCGTTKVLRQYLLYIAECVVRIFHGLFV